jgi:hypothetical protein
MELIELNLALENHYGMRHDHFLASRRSNFVEGAMQQKQKKSMVRTPIHRELK